MRIMNNEYEGEEEKLNNEYEGEKEGVSERIIHLCLQANGCAAAAALIPRKGKLKKMI